MNESILEWLEDQRRKQNGTLDSWLIKFVTEGFYVHIKGGEETTSDPPSYLENVSEYKTVQVELFDRSDLPPLKQPKSQTTWEPLNIPTPSGGITINFDVKVFPHTGIYPAVDERFKDQPWAEKFENYDHTMAGNGFAPSATLTLEELSEVMNYLVKLDNLVAFL